MHQGPSPSRSPSAQELCKVTVLVPMDCVERIRQFAQELRARQHVEPVPTRLEWQTVSPSVELVVSRDCSARCVVRDTRAAGEDRFRWTDEKARIDPVIRDRLSRGRTNASCPSCTTAHRYRVRCYVTRRAGRGRLRIWLAPELLERPVGKPAKGPLR